jgi:hypothetical protein
MSKFQLDKLVHTLRSRIKYLLTPIASVLMFPALVALADEVAHGRCKPGEALQLVVHLSKDNAYRIAAEHGMIGAGRHETWMDEMMAAGAKEARFQVRFSKSHDVQVVHVVASSYFAEYGDPNSEIRDIDAETQFGAIREKLQAIALERARSKIPALLKKSDYQNAAGTLDEVLLASECLPPITAIANLEDLEDTPLMRAAEHGDLLAVKSLLKKSLLKKDEPLNAVNQRGWSALLVAMNSGQREIARTLIEAGADVNLPDKWGLTPLMLAAVHDDVDLIKLLIEYRANMDAVDTSGMSALMLAAYYGRLEATRALLANGANVNLRTADGRTALTEALKKRNQAVVNELLRSGAQVEPRSPT